jgi:3-deoxy-manno-octulosonate cytidylyltransferase (CMP-KDO synthetase)
MKIIGVVPARMAASRFPGKPLYPILGRPMLEHVFERSLLFDRWTGLFLATCDGEIADFGRSKGYPVIMTSDKHNRALERVAEAIEKCEVHVDDNDIVLNVQGDEPMLSPDMIDVAIKPLMTRSDVKGTILSMDIIHETQYYNPDVLKIIHDLDNRILYTSRSPIPYAKRFSAALGAKRIYGIFGFKWSFLKTFISLPESPLEIKEACDSNRLYDNGFHQYIAPYPFTSGFSVDSPEDIALVEEHMLKDALWGKY